MRSGLRARLELAYRKNADELEAFSTGRMPRFVVERAPAGLGGETPVFCFHDVEPRRFEAQLRHLRDNGYRTLDAAGLEQRLAGEQAGGPEPAVALTFDDATASFWTTALPLLRRYGFRAILFAIAGIVPDDETGYPTLEDLWAGRVSTAELDDRADAQPLCTWRELRAAHESGHADVQSHSMTHSRVPVSARVVDFFHPAYPLERYGNVNLPVPAGDDPRRPERALPMGAPIFESASRMAGMPRFRERPEPVAALAGHVTRRGGERFFARPRWRRELARLCRELAPAGQFETRDETDAALLWELAQSKAVLEQRLPGVRATHFCYPWFQGSAASDALAARAGYTAVHYGLALPPADGVPGEALPLRIRRLSEEYLRRLPGRGRASLASIFAARLKGAATRRRGAS